MKRDPQEDMELCSKATSGPWDVRTIAIKDVIKAYSGDNIFCIGSIAGDAVVALTDDLDLDVKSEIPNDTKFIAESREALPYWINRAVKAEKLLKESLEFIDDCYEDEIEFKARVKNFLGDDQG